MDKFVSIRLKEKDFEHLERIAKKKYLKHTTYARSLLLQGLYEEEPFGE